MSEFWVTVDEVVITISTTIEIRVVKESFFTTMLARTKDFSESESTPEASEVTKDITLFEVFTVFVLVRVRIFCIIVAKVVFTIRTSMKNSLFFFTVMLTTDKVFWIGIHYLLYENVSKSKLKTFLMDLKFQ